MSSPQLLFIDDVLAPLPVTDVMKSRLAKFVVIGGISYFAIPQVNRVMNQTLGTNYNSEKLTGNFLLGKHLTSRHMKIIRLFYSYVFTDDILATTGLEQMIKIDNAEIQAGIKSALKFLISDPTFSGNESMKDKLVDATGVFFLIATIELINKLLSKSI